MTPRQLAAWGELIMREQIGKTLRAAFTVRVAGSDQRNWTEWAQKQEDDAK